MSAITEHGTAEDLSGCFSSVHPGVCDVESPVDGRTNVQVVQSLFSEGDCRRLLAELSQRAFSAPPLFSPSVRDCTRLHTIDPGMSEVVMGRLRPYLPTTVVMDGARWRLARFTHHWRYVHYTAGGRFVPHFDGAKVLPHHAMTVFTVQIFLNDDFEGGSTRFYADFEPGVNSSHDIDYGAAQLHVHEQPTHRVLPRAGSVLMFDHAARSTLHDGEAVLSGEKWIMRGDVIYEAIEEDIPGLLAGPCATWCPETGKKYGTRNALGQVWVCSCAADQCGAGFSPPSQPKAITQDAVVRDAPAPVLLLVSGKRASGKDYVAGKIAAALKDRACRVTTGSLGSFNKASYAASSGADLDRLKSDRVYKESHRLAMVAHHAAKNKEDPLWCIKQVLARAEEGLAEVLIVSDLRTRADVHLFAAAAPSPPVIVRVAASDAARIARGWDPDPAKDALATEVDLDAFSGFASVFDNSYDGAVGRARLEEWIEHTVIPLVFASKCADVARGSRV